MAGAAQPIKIAILAMGGEGGGVLADWLVDLGESNGHLQMTARERIRAVALVAALAALPAPSHAPAADLDAGGAARVPGPGTLLRVGPGRPLSQPSKYGSDVP